MKKSIDVLIVDDEPVSRKTLHTYLRNEDPVLNVVGEAANGAEAYKAIHELKPDVVFLDVNMPDGSGLDLLDRFEKAPFMTVLYSGDRDHAIEGFKREVLYFLEKPLNSKDLDLCIDRVKRTVDQRISQGLPEGRRKIELYSKGRTHYVPLSDILYLESAGSYTVIYRENGSRMVVTRNMKSLMAELGDRLFCRIHNSYAVNISRVESCSFGQKSCLLTSGQEVRMSVRRCDELRQKLDYLWGTYRPSAEQSSPDNPLLE